MGQSSTQKQTQEATRAPWAEAQPQLQQILSNVGSYMNQPDMFAPTQGGTSKAGIDALTQYGINPTATQTAGQQIVGNSGQGYQTGLDTMTKTATGGFLNSNPYLDAALASANQRTAEKVNGQFSGAGRFGSASHGLGLGRAIGEQNNAAMLSNYQTERQNQMGAADKLMQGGLQGITAGQMIDQSKLGQAGALTQAGGMQDTYAQGVKQAPMAATSWGAGLTTPIANLGGTTSGTSTTTNTQNPNIAGMAMGGAMTGLGLMTGNPMMAMGGLSSGLGSAGFGGGGGGFGGLGGFGGGANSGSSGFWGW